MQWARQLKAIGAIAVVAVLAWTVAAYAGAWWSNRQNWKLQDILRGSACLSAQSLSHEGIKH